MLTLLVGGYAFNDRLDSRLGADDFAFIGGFGFVLLILLGIYLANIFFTFKNYRILKRIEKRLNDESAPR
jgi:hypothetical protein